MMICRSTEEIDEQLSLAQGAIETGSKFFGMTYEQGIVAMFDWLEGNREEAPMDD